MTLRFLRRRTDGSDPLACREFVELVTDYLEGALSDAARARFEAHLGACDCCEAYLEQMRAVVTTLGTPPPPADARTREALLQAFRDVRG